MTPIKTALLGLTLLLIACGPAQDPTPPEPGFFEPIVEEHQPIQEFVPIEKVTPIPQDDHPIWITPVPVIDPTATPEPTVTPTPEPTPIPYPRWIPRSEYCSPYIVYLPESGGFDLLYLDGSPAPLGPRAIAECVMGETWSRHTPGDKPRDPHNIWNGIVPGHSH